MPHDVAAEDKTGAQRVRVAYIYALLAFATLSVFGSLQILVEGNPLLGYLEIAGGITTLLAAGGLWLTRNANLTCNLVLLSILVMLAVMLITGGTANTGLFWVFIFPVSAFFLTSRRGGVLWMFALYAVILLVMLGAQYDFISTPYTPITLRQLLVSLVVVTIGIYVYERSREAIAKEAQQSDVTSIENRIKADIIIENIGEGVIASDTSGRIILVNKAAADMLGWDVDSLKDKVFIEAIPMLDAAGNKLDPDERPMSQVLRKGVGSQFSATYIRRDGSSLPAHVTNKPIVIDGKVHGAIVTIRDITAEQAIDRAKSEFVTLASHQLRTPISAISWVGELLLHGDAGKLKPEQAEYVQQIYKSNKRMASLVDAMLTASSLELGSLPIHPEKVDLTRISREVLEQRFDALPADKVLHVKEQYDPELPSVFFDPNIVRTILQNLLANAFKYTPSDGSVAIAIKQAEDDIIIEVSDTGVGIPSRQQPKIFTRLFRAENIKRQDTDGTGLGLYIVKAITEYVGGSISFTSQENKGSTFTVRLPRKDMRTKQGGRA